jgi:hypothetical protein
MIATWIGIDPGYHGAIAVLDDTGTMQCVWDIPLIDRKARTRKSMRIDLSALNAIFAILARCHDPIVRSEWPTTRPDEAAESSKQFGVGLGHLEALCAAHGLRMERVAPNRWKGDLGLPGKKADPKAAHKACAFCERYVMGVPHDLVWGPRGGPKDGRAEAMLLAWHGWSRTSQAMRVLRERWGNLYDSDETLAFCLMAGSRRRRRKRADLPI